MNLKNWPKIIWVFILSLLAGLFMASGDLVNFFMNLVIPPNNFDPFFLHNVLDNFSLGFFYTVTPLITLFFIFNKNTPKIIKIGLVGAIVFPIIIIVPRLGFINIFPQLHNFFLLIFEPIFKGFFGTFIYFMYYAFIGFILGVSFGWIYRKIKPEKVE